MSYGIKAVDYLARARRHLDNKQTESLFYAAFELRCGIEARLKEYFDAQAETTKKKRSGWRIDKLAKQVESVFKLGNKGLRLTVFEAETQLTIAVILYTPVTPQLRKMCERLGDYLHSSECERENADPYWADMRKKLEMTYAELGFAASGTLLAPPLAHPAQQGQSFFASQATSVIFSHLENA